MQTRRLGHSDLHLTAVGLGTWAIGGSGWAYAWGPQDDAESIATIRRALDMGINWIDTAPTYGLGHSEEIIGQAIAGRQDRVIIATKCGLVWDVDGTAPYGRLEAVSIHREVEASLRRLNVETIDLFQIHWPDPDKDIEEAWSAIADLVKEGKVRYGGVSNFSIEQLKRVQAIHPVASLQSPYNMLRRGIEKELLTYCVANDIGVIGYSPLQSGLLTGKFTKERVANLPDDDWRKRNHRFREPELSVNLAFVEQLKPIAERSGMSLAQMTIAWVLRRPEVTATIVGARHPFQIEETVQVKDWGLSEKDCAETDVLLAGLEKWYIERQMRRSRFGAHLRRPVAKR